MQAMRTNADLRPARHLLQRWAGVAGAVLLHAAVITAALQYAPARKALEQAVPLMVSLIVPPPPPKPTVLPKPLPVKPVPHVEPRRQPPPPVLAATTDAPAVASEPPPPPVPVDPVLVSVPSAPVATTPAPPPAPPIKPAPVTPPIFNAAYLNNPPPTYPAVARRLGLQGKVVLRVFVSAAGNAERVEVRSSGGHDALDQAALNAVRRWRFVPARQGDQPVAAWVLVPLLFTLEG